MEIRVPIFTYLQGQTSGKVVGRMITTERPDGELLFAIGPEKYSARLDLQLCHNSRIVLFDGFLPACGLPRGAVSLQYNYWPHDEPDPRDHGLPKRLDLVENTATVKHCDSYALSRHEYQERVGRKDGTTVVFLWRHLLAIPIGHTALGYRIKPRSLAYQHTTIESSKEDVIFRSIVK